MLVATFSLDTGGLDYWKVIPPTFPITLAPVPTPLGNVELELKRVATESSPFRLATAFPAPTESQTTSTSKTHSAKMESVAPFELRTAIYTT